MLDEEKYDVILIQETWLPTAAQFQHPFYDVHKINNSTKTGGNITLVNKKL